MARLRPEGEINILTFIFSSGKTASSKLYVAVPLSTTKYGRKFTIKYYLWLIYYSSSIHLFTHLSLTSIHLSPTCHPPAASTSIGPRRVSRSSGATPSCLSRVGDLRHCGVLTISCPSQCSTNPASFRLVMLPQNHSDLLWGFTEMFASIFLNVNLTK